MTEPARWGPRRTALDWLDRAGLARPAVRFYELMLAARARERQRTANDLPLPPSRLRVQAGPAHADAEYFLRSGRHHAELIRALLGEQGVRIEAVGPLLDFGCGCGRVLRHWADLEGTRRYGCDVTAKMVAWCADNLPFADVTVNRHSPPLPYDDDDFGLVYAFSVFTHLTEESQHEWMREIGRVLRPGGFLIVSTLGEHYLSLGRLTAPEQDRFRRGELVVLYERSSGTSLCSAYHPLEYVREKLAGEFEVIGFRPAADDGKHDVHLLRKRSAA
jgi:SAM-dependent methyltransferase